jgi:UDP-glucose 4-epimerase
MSPWKYQTNWEEVIADVVKASGVTAILLRYFNPIGSQPSIEIRITAGVPQNLVPFITQTGMGLREELSVYGDDYQQLTELAFAIIYILSIWPKHVIALQRLVNKKMQMKLKLLIWGQEQEVRF